MSSEQTSRDVDAAGLPLTPVLEAVAQAVPERLALVDRRGRLTYAGLNDRTRRFANFLLSMGLTSHTPRERLEYWQSGQDHVAIYMLNCREYLECLVGCAKARAVGINVNYRYVADELRYLLTDSDAKAIVYHARFAPMVADILPTIEQQKCLVQVADDSGNPLLHGALDYEEILAGASDADPALDYSADDLHILYTGGTTGMPKGVLWRHGDFLASHLGGKRRDGSIIENIEEFVATAVTSKGFRALPATPFMHGIGQLASLRAWTRGDCVVLPNKVDTLDAGDLLERIESEGVNLLTIAGDAFARPILEEMRRREYDLSSLRHIVSSGAILSVAAKDELKHRLPHITIIDALGSTETGPHVENTIADRDGAKQTEFRISENSVVFSEDMSRLLEPGHQGLGWFAINGQVPLGYLGDPEKTSRSFPVFQGKRYVVAGDRVRLIGDRVIAFHGRDSMTINSGGEKVFVEEVEQTLFKHDDVVDVVVTSRPSERWGNEVVAAVVTRNGGPVSTASLLAEAEKHLARYKLPKAFLFVTAIPRGANGKADYRQVKMQFENNQRVVEAGEKR